MATRIEHDQLHRYSLDEYHRLIDAGAFEGQRVELIDGLLVTMSPKTTEHESAIRWLNLRLARGIDPEVHDLGVGNPLTIGRSEPEPDLIVVRRDASAPYHFDEAELVIEVAWSSLRHDLVVKAELYAAAGLGDYWVVDLHAGRIVVHRDPGPEGYATVTEVRGGTLRPLAAGLPAIDVDGLLAAAGR